MIGGYHCQSWSSIRRIRRVHYLEEAPSSIFHETDPETNCTAERNPMRAMRIAIITLLVLTWISLSHDLGEITAEMGEDGWKTVAIEGAMLSWIEVEDSFTFMLEAPASGWVAVGFGGGPAMKDASLILGYRDDEGAHYRDDHGTSPVSHSPDAENGGTDDIISADVTESENGTVLSFTIPMDPQDGLDPKLEPGGSVRMIFAWSDRDGFSGMHSEAHTAQIRL